MKTEEIRGYIKIFCDAIAKEIFQKLNAVRYKRGCPI